MLPSVGAVSYVRIVFLVFNLRDIFVESFSLRNELSSEAISNNNNAPSFSRKSESSTQFQNADRIRFENLKFHDVVLDDENGTVFRFDKYFRTTEIYNFMDYLQRKHTDLVEIFDIGKTWENRTIRTMKISSKNPYNTAIWIDGGIHAREWISISSVCFIMFAILKNWHDLDPVYRNTDYYLTPVLNPDGYEFSHGKRTRLWRKNRRKIDYCYGVDLNRNFPYKWGSSHYSVRGHGQKNCGEEFAGIVPLSEPETRAVADFIMQSSRTLKGFLSFHTYGQSILYPYGYEPRLPKDVVKLNYVGQMAAKKIRNVTGLEYEVTTGTMLSYAFPGNSMDWAYKVANIGYSYLVELRNTSSFILPPSDIIPAGKEALIIAMTLVDNFDLNEQELHVSPPDGLLDQRKWQEREEQLVHENQKLKQELSNISIQKVKILQSKLNTANEMINKLNDNLKNATNEWNKREIKLVEECNHLKYQIQNTPKIISPDVERLQEQLKDTQEINLKLKFDYDSYKDKCTALEHLCADLKKIIMDEQIAEKLYANDKIPASVKQFLSSSSSSVINTLSHVFGCLSKSSSRNRFHSLQRDDSIRKELFTTNESLMINDLSRTYEQNEIIKELIKEKEQLKKENMDLNRQVKELEQIVRRRAHPNFSHVSEIIQSNNESKQREQESETVKNLKKELLDKQYVIIDLKNQLVELKAKYDQSLLNLQGKVVNIQEESIKLKEELDRKKNVVVVTHAPKCKRRGRTCDPPPPSVRNFRTELTAKDREIQTLSKQLEELKRANKKLVKEKGQCVSYLSSKEQSADDIHISRKQASEVNSEINSPDKTFSDFLKNSNFEIQKNYDGIDTNKSQLLKSIEDTNKIKTVNFDKNKNDLKIGEHPNETTNIDSNDANDYKVLSNKLNYLEEKHQNLQQITCNLLTLFSKEKQAAEQTHSFQNNEELHQIVTKLKDFSA